MEYKLIHKCFIEFCLMIIECSQCFAKYKLPEDAIAYKKMRCSSCGFEWEIDHQHEIGQTLEQNTEEQVAEDKIAEEGGSESIDQNIQQAQDNELKEHLEKSYAEFTAPVRDVSASPKYGFSIFAMIFALLLLIITNLVFQHRVLLENFPELHSLYEYIGVSKHSDIKIVSADFSVKDEQKVDAKVIIFNPTDKDIQNVNVTIDVYNLDHEKLGKIEMNISEVIKANDTHIIEGRLKDITGEPSYLMVVVN